MSNRTQTRNDVYEHLKFWDKKRAQILKQHKKSIEQIEQFLERRIIDSKQYIFNLENLIEHRVKQLMSIAQNSIMNSDFVLQKNKANAYQAHYQVLKDIIGLEAKQMKENDNKIKRISGLFEEIRDFTQKQRQGSKQQSNDSNNSNNSNNNSKLDDSSIVLTKGNIRYMIDCELQQIVSEVIELGEKVSSSYNTNNKTNNQKQKQDMYICFLAFIHATHKQCAKHREIGRQLLTLTSATMKKQIKIQHKIRYFINKWSQFQGQTVTTKQPPTKSINDITTMIKTYYDLNQIANIRFEQPTIQDFLINFRIDPFTDHQRLVLCQLHASYNNKIQSIVLITLDNYVHLLRMNNPKPDFSFCINSELQIKKTNDRTVEIVQNKKWMYFKKEVQFQFMLEFVTEEEFVHFRGVITKISNCKIK